MGSGLHIHNQTKPGRCTILELRDEVKESSGDQGEAGCILSFPGRTIICSWNCWGLKHAVVRALRVIINSHKPHILLLSKVKISRSRKFVNLMSSLHFEHVHFVVARGKVGGLPSTRKVMFLFK